MRILAISLVLGLALVSFGASEAKAACVDFSSFCDCLTLDLAGDVVGGTSVNRTVGTWVNQDCAGTTSPMQGMYRQQLATLTGELNPALGFPGNFNFTIRVPGAGRVFDLDYWDGVTATKFQDDSPWTLVAGSCAPGCSPPGRKAGLAASHGR